jgi:uncharacterized membrane protein YhhN
VTTLSWGLLALTLVVAAADWVAVGTDRRRLEHVLKPATMVALIGLALSLAVDEPAARWCFVGALAFSLVGDVFLMLEDRHRWFPFGLGAFLVAHLAYVPGLWILGVSTPGLVVGSVLVAIALAVLAPRIVGAVRESQPVLRAPVVAYMAVISLMVVSAVGTTMALAVVGAFLFYASDALIAWTAFVRDVRHGRTAIMVTYHLGQILLVLALVGGPAV